ncbi:hypothetical protein GON26_20840 [Flavobacterium sp. GA093]|uniref:Uncharacterized protein n=1 Tax=Flavobacterium hydrocarbonoxydans TaxID=2683249 RepID=A0A6I4P0R7_9FLAO|nr:hypothetical protein [Flavobacterium hydrocarbonoxydans]MWB96817.1 hypothetical protein [Flavobacterium hydrocarbonoxydans]
MRKVIVFFVYLSMLLFGGGQYISADTHFKNKPTSHHLEKHHRIKFTNQDQGSSLIEEADIDIDEEFHSGDNLKEGGSGKYPARTYNLQNSWYSPLNSFAIVNSNCRRFTFLPRFCSNSSTIYITQRVLRI